jgi:hypothetical protein
MTKSAWLIVIVGFSRPHSISAFSTSSRAVLLPPGSFTGIASFGSTITKTVCAFNTTCGSALFFFAQISPAPHVQAAKTTTAVPAIAFARFVISTSRRGPHLRLRRPITLFPLHQKLLQRTKEIGRLLREKQERLENQASNREGGGKITIGLPNRPGKLL